MGVGFLVEMVVFSYTHTIFHHLKGGGANIERVNHEGFPDQLVTVVIPEFVAESLWDRLLQNQTANRLRRLLGGHKDVVVIDVPNHILSTAQWRAARTRADVLAEQASDGDGISGIGRNSLPDAKQDQLSQVEKQEKRKDKGRREVSGAPC
jgi:hypothetical protein